MQLTVISDGVLLSQKDGCFQLRKGDQKKRISPQRLTSILLCNRCQLTTQALVLAMEHHIDVLLLNHYGEPVGRFWYGQHGRSVRIRRVQLKESQTLEGFLYALPWLKTRLHGQGQFLKQLAKSRPKKVHKMEPFILQIENAQEALLSLTGELFDAIGRVVRAEAEVTEYFRERVMGVEGSASRAFFRGLSYILPEPYSFSSRSRRPAQDPFNAALNYAYGILYGRVERACLLAGLDPYVGFLHTDHPYRPALVCDLIEPFRIWAERVVTFLFTRRKLNQSHFLVTSEGVFLDSSGKELLVPAFQEHVDEKIRLLRRNVPRGSICLHEAHRLANGLMTSKPLPSEWFLEVAEF